MVVTCTEVMQSYYRLLRFNQIHSLTRAPMGYSRTLPADGGGRFGPPAICQTTGPILGPKTALDSSGFELFEYIAQLYL